VWFLLVLFFFFSSRRRHTRFSRDWSSDVCSSDLDTRIEAYCHFDSADIGSNCRIGPYARLRPGTQLAEAVHVGNFCEVKASTIRSEERRVGKEGRTPRAQEQ